MITDNLKSGQPRVLVVENDLRWRQDHLTNLTRWGYRPFLAEGQGKALLQDARDRAKTYRCHVALVDMRLLDHYDTSDSSGLHLVPQLSPTRSIIVTAYSSEDLLQKALKEKGADEFINKREGRKLLKKALENSLQRICAAKKGIEFQWLDGLSGSIIISFLFGANSGVPADQVQDLLGLLFPNATRLRLERFTGHISAQNVVPLKVYVDHDPLASQSPQAQVVEIGKKEDIQSQQPPNQSITPDNYVYLWDLGAKIESTP